MKPPFDFILHILCAAWRRRYLICAPILFMPFIGLIIGQNVTTSYKARTSVLVQESAKRLAGDDLDDVVMKELRPKGEDGEEVEAGPVEKIFGLVASLQRFANSLK